MLPDLPSENNPGSGKPPEDLSRIHAALALIRTLTPREKDRLAWELSRRTKQWFPRWMILRRSLVNVLMNAFYFITDDAVDSLQRLKEIARTHQRKRQPSATTLDLLAQIKPLKEAGVTWRVIERRLSMKPGTARQIWRDARRRGWTQ